MPADKEENKEEKAIDVDDIELERLSSYAVKAEFYIISLTFSIIALSIQFPISIKKADLMIAVSKESGWLMSTLQTHGCIIPMSQTFGWLSLAISGIFGIVVLRKVSGKYNILLNKLRTLKKGKDSESSFDKQLAKELSAIQSNEFLRFDKWGVRWLSIQNWSLILGLSSLILSRILVSFFLWFK